MNLSRREFLALLAQGTVSLGFLRLISLIPSSTQADVLRPPGAVEEEDFNRLCLRCSICLEVCPTGTIILAGLGDGVSNINTPKLNPVSGPCEFYRGRCEETMRCSEFCPTGALQRVRKNDVKVGTVEFNSDTCLAYLGKECLICSEMCPSIGAITPDKELKPIFDGEKCVGCGICVNRCPADPKALILKPKGVKRVKWSI